MFKQRNDATIMSDIRDYIKNELRNAKQNGLSHKDIISGDIHKAMKFDNRMPMICNAMYQLMSGKDEILHKTPSGFSSTIEVRYFL